MVSCVCQNDDCLLCEAHLYSGLSPEHVCDIRGKIAKNYYDEGDIIFQQGQEGDYLHIVREGMVKLSLSDADGNEQIVGLCLAGHVVGFDVLGDSKHTYTAEALTPVMTCTIRQPDMTKVFAENPIVAQKTIRMLNQELAFAQNLIHMLGQKSSEEKVALFILSLIPRITQTQLPIKLLLPLSRKEMAQFLGLTVETVSRLISDFKRRGIIETPRGELHILNIKPLKQIAGIDSVSVTDGLKSMVLNQQAAI
ncbi:MAG: Crp/Fnr family transcriptional regulator [Gammaproteobacteria bacterium]|nr:Crp/Fnr family transcriptional regulator [Gammaproteobacteria bacterium]